MVATYRDPDRTAGRHQMNKLLTPSTLGVPAALTEIRGLGRTLKQPASEILAHSDRPGTSKGPT